MYISGWSKERSPSSSRVSIVKSSSATEMPPAPSPRKTSETFQSACKKHRNVIIVSVIFIIIIVCLISYQGRSVPPNHQKEAIKCPPVTGPPVTCPHDWIAHQGHCYNLSRVEKNWEESQNLCILHNASLGKITDEEMELVMKLTRNHVFWIGLKREPGQPWKWQDGANATLRVIGNGGNCAFLNDDATASSGSCSTEHRYICKKK